MDGKNDTEVGKQFGVKNVEHWDSARSIFNAAPWMIFGCQEPGYLMGSPGVFGTDFDAKDADEILNT